MKLIRNYSVFIVFSTVLASQALASDASLDQGKGLVEFDAIGRPSALHIHGKGSVLHGKITLTKAVLSGTASFELASLTTGIETRDEHMKKKYLETEKYPLSTLTVTSLSLPGDLSEGKKYEKIPFTGTLTLHGVTQSVSGTATVSKDGNQLSVIANFGIKLTDYSIAIPSFAGITVAEDVTVSVDTTSPVTSP